MADKYGAKLQALTKALEEIGLTGEQVALVLLHDSVEATHYPDIRQNALARVMVFADKARGCTVEGALKNAYVLGYDAANVLQALLKHWTGEHAWHLLANLRRGWCNLLETSQAHKVLLMYAALDQEAVDEMNSRPVIEGAKA